MSWDALFHGLSFVGVLLYPSFYLVWKNTTLVDHEVHPGLLFALALPLSVTYHGIGSCFRSIMYKPLLRLRSPVPSGEGSESGVAVEQRFLARTWKMVELALLSLLGWYLIFGEQYFPRSLGGVGESCSMFDIGRRFVPLRLAAYHAVRLAYVVEWWVFEDGLERPALTMHHLATVALIVLAVVAGHSKFGSVIICIHDSANVPTQILVWLQQVSFPSILTVITYVVSVYTWCHLMLFTFTVEVLVPSVIERHRGTLEWKVAWFMFGLLLLHHVWVIVRLLEYLPRFLKSPSAGLAEAQRSQREKSD